MNLTLFTSFGVINFGQFLLGTIAIILLPGPNSLYVLSSSAKWGWRYGAFAAIGIIVGDAILMLTAVLGATAMLNAMPMFYLGLKWVGAVYLAWIGLSLIKASIVKWFPNKELKLGEKLSIPVVDLDNVHPTRAALGLALTNPKAIFFFLSFFTQFVDASATSPGIAFLILGSVLQLISLIYLSTIIVTGAALSKAFNERYRLAAFGMAAVGIIFVGFGVNLILG
jgi:leucine efflux protein